MTSSPSPPTNSRLTQHARRSALADHPRTGRIDPLQPGLSNYPVPVSSPCPYIFDFVHLHSSPTKTIQSNFPTDKQTAETAWLFLQLVIRQLKDGGRCGIVVPNGILFGAGVGARIKQQLVTECNLHTVVRLPDGVFEPYTAIPANLLFFEKTGRTKEVWFYEIPPPEGRKKYSKTKPMRFEEFADCQAWWSAREENERAWRVPIADLETTDFNLDLRNPNRPDDLAHRPPEELIAQLISTEREILGLLQELEREVAEA